MASESIRRGHLIYGSGVGGLTVLRDGTSVICAGLDYWFRKQDGSADAGTIESHILSEWRLTARLGVQELRAPPARPEDSPRWSKAPGAVGVPFLRFPQWHVCTFCRELTYQRNRSATSIKCNLCSQDGKGKRFLVQVPLITLCADGHLQEFPWTSWIQNCSCETPALKLRQAGGSGLANYTLSCTNCGKRRTLRGALNEAGLGQCPGERPWVLGAEPDRCDFERRGALRNATNVYFPEVVSSVFVPRQAPSVPRGLLDVLGTGRLPQVVSALLTEPADAPSTLKLLRAAAGSALDQYDNEQLSAAMRHLALADADDLVSLNEGDYRKAEFDVLCRDIDDTDLLVKKSPIEAYGSGLPGGFAGIGLVQELVVTKALAGFGRLFPPGSDETTRTRQGTELLWKSSPPRERRWLPATRVKGEGLFIILEEERVRAWENRDEVKRRVRSLVDEARSSRYATNAPGDIGARLILLHTLSHLIIHRMVFNAGYSAASLSERLYAREPSDLSDGMAAVLVYTASGDADGSLGGLVRLGLPGVFETTVTEAIADARWCSTDPVCMELGGSERQGPDGLNLAACHACAHVPETACESFNVLLDRALVIGSFDEPDLGYFSGHLPW